MLTATYSLVAIRAEQDKAHRLLFRLQQYIHSGWQSLRNLDFAVLESAFNKMLHFDNYCRGRKVELYLVPAIRRVTREADALLAELESLSTAGAEMIRLARSQLANVFETGGAAAHEACRSIDQYCFSLQARLRKEDAELFPLARRVLSIEEWFSIAAQFLSDDGGGGRHQRHSLPFHGADGGIGYRHP